MRRMKWIGLGFGLLLLWEPLMAQRLPVRSEQFEVYEKEISGFEWLLPASRMVVRDSMVSYLGKQTDRITVFEDMILLESVRYAPVSVWQPVSLVFLLDQDTDRLTRVRAGGLINYQQSITVRETPDLTVRLLLDFDQITRFITGDSLDFDLLVQNLTSRDILEKYHARVEGYKWNLYVDRRPEEVVPGTGLTLRNPEAFTKQEIKRPDEQVAEEISLRFQRYAAASGREGIFLGEEEVSRIRELEDSIRNLELKIVTLNERQNRDRIQEQASTGSVRVDTVLIRDTVVIEPAESLISKSELLQEENDQLRQRLREKDQELEVVFSRLERKEQELARQTDRQRSPDNQPDEAALQPLRDTILQQELSIRDLTIVSDSLRELLLILQPESEAAKARRAIYLRQQIRMEEARQSLVEESLAVSAREKRVDQRERFLADQDESLQRDSLLRRITELENALIEERRVPRQDLPLVRPGTIRTEEMDIPRLSIQSELPPSWTREQLISWLRTYELPYSDQGDEFQVLSDELPGMGDERYVWSIRISPRESGSVIHHTFRQSDDQYLDLSTRTLESLRAARMIQDIFR